MIPCDGKEKERIFTVCGESRHCLTKSRRFSLPKKKKEKIKIQSPKSTNDKALTNHLFILV